MCWIRRTCWAGFWLGGAATPLSQVVLKTSYRKASSASEHARKYAKPSSVPMGPHFPPQAVSGTRPQKLNVFEGDNSEILESRHSSLMARGPHEPRRGH